MGFWGVIGGPGAEPQWKVREGGRNAPKADKVFVFKTFIFNAFSRL